MKILRSLPLALFLLTMPASPLLAGGNQLLALEQPITLSGSREFRIIGRNQWVLADASAATLMIWVKPAASANREQHLISVSISGSNAGWASRAAIALLPNAGLRAWGRPKDKKNDPMSGNSPAGVVPTGQWSHIAVTIDFSGKSMRFYVNGKPSGDSVPVSFAQARTDNTPSNTIAVGAEDDGSDFFFHGSMAKLGIFPRALSPEEIHSYAAQRPAN